MRKESTKPQIIGGKAAYASANAFHLNFQLLGKSRQDFAAGFGDQNYIFQADSAERGIVQAGLNREHLPIF